MSERAFVYDWLEEAQPDESAFQSASQWAEQPEAQTDEPWEWGSWEEMLGERPEIPGHEVLGNGLVEDEMSGGRMTRGDVLSEEVPGDEMAREAEQRHRDEGLPEEGEAAARNSAAIAASEKNSILGTDAFPEDVGFESEPEASKERPREPEPRTAPVSYDLLNDLLGHLRTQIGIWVESERRSGRDPDPQAQRAHAGEVIAGWFASAAERRLVTGEAMLSEAQEQQLAETALNYAFGAGPWERYINDPNLSDIHINGHDTVWLVDRAGRKHRGEPVAASDEELIQQIRWAGASLGRTSRRFDTSSPVLNMRLPNGSRLHAIMDVSMVPMVTIRMHDPTLSTLAQLRQGGMFDEAIENFLRAAVLSRHNIVICGGMGTGKTTLCRALLNEIPPEDRIITVEDELELGIYQFPDRHPDVGVLEARPANLEGAGEFSLESLLRECLRMHADRIVVGEVRGTEVLGMLLAMTSGQDGSLCTIHANSTKEAFERLAMYASMTAQHYSQAFTYRLVGSAVNFVIHIGRWEGQRYITSIREVVGSTETHVQSNEIWRPGPDGRAVPAGEPLRVEPTLRRLEAHGLDRSLMERASSGYAMASPPEGASWETMR